MLILILIVCVGSVVGWNYWNNNHVGVVDSLGYLKLNMSEVDVTLTYGRKPDCEQTQGDTKMMGFRSVGLTCDDWAYLDKGINNKYQVNRICSFGARQFSPKNMHNIYDESDVVDKLGSPTSVSISEDGTSKIDNFENNNIAVGIQGSSIRFWCVSNALPIAYEKEHK